MAIRLRSFEPTSRRQQSLVMLMRSCVRFFLFFCVAAGLVWNALSGGALSDRARKYFLDGVSLGVYALKLPRQGIVQAWDHTVSYFSLKSENDRLVAENDRLRRKVEENRYLFFENADLRRQVRLDEPLTLSQTARCGGIVDVEGMRSLFLLSGDDQGIQSRQAVHTNGHVVGRILETGHHSARVLMITDRTSRVPVVLEKSGMRGIAAGDGGASLSLSLKKGEADVTTGELVFTSGEGGIYPQGLIVGHVTNAERGGHRLTIAPNTDIDRAAFVSVVAAPLDITLSHGPDSGL